MSTTASIDQGRRVKLMGVPPDTDLTNILNAVFQIKPGKLNSIAHDPMQAPKAHDNLNAAVPVADVPSVNLDFLSGAHAQNFNSNNELGSPLIIGGTVVDIVGLNNGIYIQTGDSKRSQHPSATRILTLWLDRSLVPDAIAKEMDDEVRTSGNEERVDSHDILQELHNSTTLAARHAA